MASNTHAMQKALWAILFAVLILLLFMVGSDCQSYIAQNRKALAVQRAFGLQYATVTGSLVIAAALSWLLTLVIVGLVEAGLVQVFSGSSVAGLQVTLDVIPWYSWVWPLLVLPGLALVAIVMIMGLWWWLSRRLADILQAGS
jgi:hypothetical protein